MPNRDGTGPAGFRKRDRRGGCQRQSEPGKLFSDFSRNQSGQQSKIGLNSNQILTALSIAGSLAGSLITAFMKSRRKAITAENEREVIDITPVKESENRLEE